MQKRFTTANDAFKYYFYHIKDVCGITGGPVDKSKLFDGTAAIFNESFTIVYPHNNHITEFFRKWNLEYAMLEYEWYKSSDRNPAMVEAYAKLWSTIKDERGYVNSNYGYWWKRNNQLDAIIQMLKDKPDTRRAVITHYSPDELQDYNKDMPCNIVLNFFIVKGELNLTIFARSIDLVYGFCNDQYCFSMLMIDVADKLDIPISSMTYFITNLHIYEKHWYINDRKELIKIKVKRNKLKL